MARLKLEEGKKYTFTDYFNFNCEPKEIAAALEYDFQVRKLTLPHVDYPEPEEIARLRQVLNEGLPKIGMGSEMAKREFLIAPVLFAVIRYADVEMDVEYPIQVDDRLSGSLDYLLRAAREMVVIEAKRGDPDHGFNQLIAEMVALDQAEDEEIRSDQIYGAVSIGSLWQFGILHRAKKKIERDVQIYSVPNDLESLFGVLLGILQSK